MNSAASMPHDTAHQHVSGSARYVDDIPTPQGTLHLAFGLSPIAAGGLTSIELSAVRAFDGVRLVLEAKDLPFTNDVSPSNNDEPLLATTTIHYAGPYFWWSPIAIIRRAKRLV